MSAHALPHGARWILVAVFTALSVLAIRNFDTPFLRRFDLLILALSTAAVLTSLVWFFLLGVHSYRQGSRRHGLWALAFLVPYVNLIAASYYARLYWKQGARAPALLAIAGILAQAAISIRALSPPLPLLA